MSAAAQQLELLPPDPADKLTPRQQLALTHIRDHYPVPNDELGAILHHDRQTRGGRGHPADQRCQWCHDEGSQMGRALRRHKLVTHRREAGWVPAGTRKEATTGKRTSTLTPDIPW